MRFPLLTAVKKMEFLQDRGLRYNQVNDVFIFLFFMVDIVIAALGCIHSPEDYYREWLHKDNEGLHA